MSSTVDANLAWQRVDVEEAGTGEEFVEALGTAGVGTTDRVAVYRPSSTFERPKRCRMLRYQRCQEGSRARWVFGVFATRLKVKRVVCDDRACLRFYLPALVREGCTRGHRCRLGGCWRGVSR
jgi:hypothetical protein